MFAPVASDGETGKSIFPIEILYILVRAHVPPMPHVSISYVKGDISRMATFLWSKTYQKHLDVCKKTAGCAFPSVGVGTHGQCVRDAGGCPGSSGQTFPKVPPVDGVCEMLAVCPRAIHGHAAGLCNGRGTRHASTSSLLMKY